MRRYRPSGGTDLSQTASERHTSRPTPQHSGFSSPGGSYTIPAYLSSPSLASTRSLAGPRNSPTCDMAVKRLSRAATLPVLLLRFQLLCPTTGYLVMAPGFGG